MSKSFCIQPWISFGVRTYGGMCICPEMNYVNDAANISEITPEEFRTSPAVVKIRQDMIAGKPIEACRGCGLRDTLNLIQPELKEVIIESKNIAPQKLSRLRLDLGNHCNLMCPTCGIHGSSNWEKVVRPITKNQFSHMKFDWSQKLRWEENPYELLSEIEDLTFSGGEPLIIKECADVLKKLIDMGKASEVKLHYITNATIKPDDFVDLWSHFKSVDLSLSVDATGSRYEFLRSPAKWVDTEKNIHSYLNLPPHITIHISQHVSIFNLYHLCEYSDWFEKLKNKYPWRTIVLNSTPIANPSYLTLASFSNAQKEQAITWLENNAPSLLNMDVTSLTGALLKSLDESHLETLYKRKVFIKTFLKNSAFDMDKIFPELSESRVNYLNSDKL